MTTMNAQTVLCAIIGNPVAHSLSPLLHNTAYASLGLNFVWLGFTVSDVKHALAGMRALDIRGFAVTIPHKETVIPYLDSIDVTAKTIGAVNTIVNTNGKLHGTNTDWIGAMHALKEKTEIQNKTAVVLGAGGAARALIFGLQKEQAKHIVILNRHVLRAKKLAQEFSDKGRPAPGWNTLDNTKVLKKADIIINTTSVGMHPHTNTLPIDASHLHKNQVVFDSIFNPKETLLLKKAKEKGCTVVYGIDMLVYQAVHQFKLFTKKDAPIAIMKQALKEA